ncbi:hypothetical protein [Bradyrhizobium lablabi]|uniref:hypothetical protein n=1 Tax=Bradyrhizobium lablabi TaxID=722472 RepID=UPI001BA97C7A|nr:hypothetical protein [Bradyrhizobium lablabi]MBR0694160.1 hypothetical protein [Bradyrhizobium lablabi]
MQQQPRPGAVSADSPGYVFYFQLASNGARRACSLTIQAASANEATRIFRENWTTIETMARDGVSEGTISSTPVNLQCRDAQIGATLSKARTGCCN